VSNSKLTDQLLSNGLASFPAGILSLSELCPRSKLLYIFLCDKCIGKPYSPVSIDEIKALLRCSSKQVKCLTDKLVNLGLIRVKYRKFDTKDWYALHLGTFPDEYVAPTGTELPEKPVPSKHNKLGYVYVIRSQGRYKIGRSKRQGNRIAHHQTSSPFPIDVVAEVMVSDDVVVERELHDMFDSGRVNGEWFELGPNELGRLESYLVERAL
jgi:hypothetical protein